MPAKVAFALIAEAFVFGLILFGSAGTLRWPAGWYFLFLFFGAAALITARLARHDPALLDERMKAFNQKGQPLWDQIFLVLVLLGFIAWLVVMGLDARFGWSAVAAPLQLVGAVGVVTGFWIVDRVFRENTFAAPVVKMQAERGQKVISTGPYAVVRHPMYAGAAPLLIGAGLLLGSWWGVVGALLIIAAIAVRALGEEAVLLRDLAGYGDYQRKVRWRLMPGVW